MAPPLDLLAAHYRDSCEALQAHRSQRDRLFVYVLLLLVGVLLDTLSPALFRSQLSSALSKRLELSPPLDLTAVSVLLWFALLAFVVRYCQATIHLERQYSYVHRLEEELQKYVPGVAFTREGKGYYAHYPLFSTWAHGIYTWLFPGLLVLLSVARMVRAFLDARAITALLCIDILIGVVLLVTLLLYLVALHRPPESKRLHVT